MSSEYDRIADEYDLTAKSHPVRQHVELHSMFNVIGDVAGLSVLDVACGTGFYTRELRRRGAARVVGVDLSEGMIRVARRAEQAAPLGVEYLVQDVGALEDLGTFDLAVGAYLLHYAATREQLGDMCRGIARSLKRGARLVTYHPNPGFAREPGYYRKYGTNVHIRGDLTDGARFAFSLILGDVTTPEITVYYWSRATIDAALQDAGLRDIRWIAPGVSEAGVEAYGSELWEDCLKIPYCMIIECTKARG